MLGLAAFNVVITLRVMKDITRSVMTTLGTRPRFSAASWYSLPLLLVEILPRRNYERLSAAAISFPGFKQPVGSNA